MESSLGFLMVKKKLVGNLGSEMEKLREINFLDQKYWEGWREFLRGNYLVFWMENLLWVKQLVWGMGIGLGW